MTQLDTDIEKINYIIEHFKNTKNAELMSLTGYSHCKLHKVAQKYNLKKTREFRKKCSRAASVEARKVSAANGWPPKGYHIPNAGLFWKELGPKAYKAMCEKISKTRRENIAKDRARILFGLPQKTKLKLVSSGKQVISQRYRLRKLGYSVQRDSRVAYINSNTHRSIQLEEKYKLNRWRFVHFEAEPETRPVTVADVWKMRNAK